MVEELTIVGKRIPPVRGPDKVTGKAKFSNDIQLPGMLHGKVLESPHAHATVTSINTSKAEALPGVKAVITHEDETGEVLTDELTYIGQHVAAVAAVSEEIAEEAVRLIDVEYEVLPAVLDWKQEWRDGKGAPSFWVWERGDIEQGFMEADVIVEGNTETQRQQHTCMPPPAVVASFDAQGNLTVWDSVQGVFGPQRGHSGVLGIPNNKVRVICEYGGTGFGGGGSRNEGYLAGLLSKKTGKPVRIGRSRRQDSNWHPPRSATIGEVRIGAKSDGTITAEYHNFILSQGAGGDSGVHAGQCIMSLYTCDNAKFDSTLVKSNYLPSGSYRGVGNTQGAFQVEQCIDELAEAVGLSPVEFRLKNAKETGGASLNDKLFNPAWPVSSCGFAECIRRGAEAIGWDGKWKGWKTPVEVNGSKRRGIGIGCMAHTGGGWGGRQGAIIKIYRDGSVHVLSGNTDCGTCSYTTAMQLAAEAVGARFEDVTGYISDSAVTPESQGSGASQAINAVTNAMKPCGEDIKRQLFEVAAPMLEVNPEDLEAKDSRVFIKADPEEGVTFAEIMKKLGKEIYASSSELFDFTLTFAARFIEVEVDTETGQVEVLRTVMAHDLGKAINPLVVESQMEGGYQQGLEFASTEGVYDEPTGFLLTPTELEYRVRTSLDMAGKMDLILLESGDPTQAWGVKGMGEPPLVITAAAVANAIYNAIGVRIREVPITPDRILKALGKV